MYILVMLSVCNRQVTTDKLFLAECSERHRSSSEDPKEKKNAV